MSDITYEVEELGNGFIVREYRAGIAVAAHTPAKRFRYYGDVIAIQPPLFRYTEAVRAKKKLEERAENAR